MHKLLFGYNQPYQLNVSDLMLKRTNVYITSVDVMVNLTTMLQSTHDFNKIVIANTLVEFLSGHKAVLSMRRSKIQQYKSLPGVSVACLKTSLRKQIQFENILKHFMIFVVPALKLSRSHFKIKLVYYSSKKIVRAIKIYFNNPGAFFNLSFLRRFQPYRLPPLVIQINFYPFLKLSEPDLELELNKDRQQFKLFILSLIGGQPLLSIFNNTTIDEIKFLELYCSVDKACDVKLVTDQYND